MQANLKAALGDSFRVLNSDEQHAIILRTIKIEKLFVYLIFTFILAVSSFNIFFALSMLAIDKKKDIGILYAMGARDKFIRSIFLKEGAIISFSGAAVGITAGFILVFLQQQYGFISMGLQTSVISYYPVKMQLADFIFTAICIVAITLSASIRPAIMATKYNSVDLL